MNKKDAILLQNRFIKKYKKNSIAVFLSFVLTITLITALLILIHTNFLIENLQWQRLYTPSDCSVNEITKGQLNKLISKGNIQWYAVQANDFNEYEKNSQFILFKHGDDEYINLTGKLDKGRMPKNQDEVVAERWALMNMGVVPEVGTKFSFKDTTDDSMRNVKLVGIISDQLSNKKFGLKCIYTTLGSGHKTYNVYLKFDKGVDYDKESADIKKHFNLHKNQLVACPGKMDKKRLHKTDFQIMSVLIMVSLIVFYGIYHIGMISKRKQYGILHAIGMTRRQIRKIILLELYEIFGVSIVFGVGTGYLVATLVKKISGDMSQDIYLRGKQVDFSNEFPTFQIGLCILIIALCVGIIGYLESKSIERSSIIGLISNLDGNMKNGNRHIRLREGDSKTRALYIMGMKFMIKDWKTSMFVVLTICVGVTLFSGLSYRHTISCASREDTREMYNLNGQYEMASMWVSSPLEGISRKTLDKVNALEGITNVKTEAGIPIRVINDKSVEKNNLYYRKLNKKLIQNGQPPIMGNDGKDDIYKTILYGYNENALNELKKYTLEGNIPSNGLASNEIILSILRKYKEDDVNAGYYKDGTPLVDYHVGDEITVKYRKDFDTGKKEFDYLLDSKAKYIYKTYKVRAIVSFPYLYDSTHSAYPLMITDDVNLQSICPDSHIHQIYLDGKDYLNSKEQVKLERELITLGNRSENISTRSLIADVDENNMLYMKQLVYIIGIAVIALILILINVITNIKYRMVVRTREISMLRAIGMSHKMVRKITIFENVTLCFIGCSLSYLVLQPILRYMYHDSTMEMFAHTFNFNYLAFLLISFLSILICIVISGKMSKAWKSEHIVENIKSLE